METIYSPQHPPRQRRAFSLSVGALNLIAILLGVSITLYFGLRYDYNNEPTDVSPIICTIPGSSLLTLRKCPSIIQLEPRLHDDQIICPQPLPRVHTVKKGQTVDLADTSLPTAHRLLKAGIKCESHIEDIQTLLGNNADLYTLVGRGARAVKELLLPIASTENVAKEKAELLQLEFQDLKITSMKNLADLESTSNRVPDSFVGLASFISEHFPTLAFKHSQKWFSWGFNYAVEAEARKFIIDHLLKGTLSAAQKANDSTNQTLATFKAIQSRLNEMAHLDKPLLPDTELEKLSKKAYWKKSLKAFKNEDFWGGFIGTVEDLAEYHTNVAYTIAFISELQETFIGLISQLGKLLADLKGVPLLSKESRGPAASLKFYGDVLGHIAHEVKQNGENMKEVGRKRALAVDVVLFERKYDYDLY